MHTSVYLAEVSVSTGHSGVWMYNGHSHIRKNLNKRRRGRKYKQTNTTTYLYAADVWKMLKPSHHIYKLLGEGSPPN